MPATVKRVEPRRGLQGIFVFFLTLHNDYPRKYCSRLSIPARMSPRLEGNESGERRMGGRQAKTGISGNWKL
jgi:hypothetical protein